MTMAQALLGAVGGASSPHMDHGLIATTQPSASAAASA